MTKHTKRIFTVPSNSCAVARFLARFNLKQHPEVAKCFEEALGVMIFETIAALCDPRVEVCVVPENNTPVWAYFPVDDSHDVAERHGIPLGPTTELLFVVSEKHVLRSPIEESLNAIAHQIGHALAFLRYPDHIHDCEEASAIAAEVGFARVAVLQNKKHKRRRC